MNLFRKFGMSWDSSHARCGELPERELLPSALRGFSASPVGFLSGKRRILGAGPSHPFGP